MKDIGSHIQDLDMLRPKWEQKVYLNYLIKHWLSLAISPSMLQFPPACYNSSIPKSKRSEYNKDMKKRFSGR